MKLALRQKRDTPPSNTPSVEDLQKKIAEMEKQLAAKDEKIAEMEKKGADVPATVLNGKEYNIFIRSNFYANVNVSITNDARLNQKSDVYAKLLYMVLCEQTISRSKVSISNNLLALKTNSSVTTVKKAVNRLEDLGYITVERGKVSKNWNKVNTYTVNHVIDFPAAEHSAFYDQAKKFIERHQDVIDESGVTELHFRRWRGTEFTDSDVVIDPKIQPDLAEKITGNKYQKADINETTGEFKADNTKKKRGKEDKKGGLRARSNGRPRRGEYNQDQELSFRSEFEDKHFRDKYFDGSSWVFNVEGKRPYQIDKIIGNTHKEVFAEAIASYIENGKISKVVNGDITMVKVALEYMGYDKDNIGVESCLIIKE